MTNRICSMRMFAYSSYVERGVWKLLRRNGDVFVERESWCDKSKQPTHFFVRGKGWVKPTKTDRVEFVEALTEFPASYDDMYALTVKHEFPVVCELLGFDAASFGNAYPRGEIYQFYAYGTAFLYWLNKIGEVDWHIAEYFKQHGISFEHSKTWKPLPNVVHPYDLWLKRDEVSASGDYCVFRRSPLLGSHIFDRIHGVFLVEPHIDVVRWDDEFYQCGTLIDDFKLFTHLKSDADIIRKLAGNELADFVINNLTFDTQDLSKYEPKRLAA